MWDTIKKRNNLTDWINKQDPVFCCIQEIQLSDKDRNYLRAKNLEKKSKKVVPRNRLE